MNDEFIEVIKNPVSVEEFGLFIDPILKWLAETLIPQSKERWWIFVYLCQSPWKSPSTSVIRCFLQLKTAMSQSHTWKPGWRFCGRAKGNSKALDALSPVSQLGYPSPTTFSNPIESDTSHRGKKFPNLFFCTFFCEEIEAMVISLHSGQNYQLSWLFETFYIALYCTH